MQSLLDPTTPANQKGLRWWATQRIRERLHPWKTLGVIILVMPILALAINGLIILVGISERWLTGLLMATTFVFWKETLPWLVQRGWLPWLLKK